MIFSWIFRAHPLAFSRCLSFACSSPCPRSRTILVSSRPFRSSALRATRSASLATSTATAYPTSHAQIQNPADTPNFLDNVFRPSASKIWIPLHDPATNHLVTRVPQSTEEELHAAVTSAERAFQKWRTTSILARQQIMFRFVALIREHWDRLAASITLEQGKTFADAKGDVLRGLQVAETACGITTQLTGEVLEVANDMETRNYKEPLGVVAAICPFSESELSRKRCRIADCCRLPGNDSSMVHPDRNRHRQHNHCQTL